MQALRSTPLVPAPASQAGLTAKFFRGLGDPTRVRVLQLLLERERTVSELVEATGVLQGRLSSHLSCLRWCGFATSRREGKLESAHGGTLFLDEIGDTSPALQVKLLRVLQEREFERVGGNHTVRIDLRVVTATHRDLKALVAEGEFREDLFYRLNVISLDLPPLRERRGDVALLADHFVTEFARDTGRRELRLSQPARRALLSYDWPGNVRELQNVIERAVILAGDSAVDLDHLPVGMAPRSPTLVALPEADVCFDQEMENFERRLILHAYEKCHRVKAQTARMLGIDRNRLRYKLKKFGVDE